MSLLSLQSGHKSVLRFRKSLVKSTVYQNKALRHGSGGSLLVKTQISIVCIVFVWEIWLITHDAFGYTFYWVRD